MNGDYADPKDDIDFLLEHIEKLESKCSSLESELEDERDHSLQQSRMLQARSDRINDLVRSLRAAIVCAESPRDCTSCPLSESQCFEHIRKVANEAD